MTTVGDIYGFIDGFAPFRLAMDFDNAGLLAGESGARVERALLALDITPGVVREAAENGAQLLVSHHPVIFHPLRSLRPGTASYLLARYGVAAICAHTNLDVAAGGVNSCLAERLGLENVRALKAYGDSGLAEALMGDTGREYPPEEFARMAGEALGCDGLFYADGNRPVSTVGLCGGAGSDYLRDAAEKGCQAFVTGEAKHHELIEAANLGVTLVVAGHYDTEEAVIRPLLELLQKRFPDVLFARAQSSHRPAKYLQISGRNANGS